MDDKMKIKNRSKPFKFMKKHGTYHYLKEQYKKGSRVVVSRYGDGEYWIMTGVKKKKIIAGQLVTEELIKLLNKSFKKEGQLICLPNKRKLTLDNLYLNTGSKKLADEICRYIISNSNHSLYGQGRWRNIDLIRYDSELVTNFFVGKTLVVSGHKEVCQKAFSNIEGVDVYGVPVRNSFGDYENIKNDLVSISKLYKNIIFSAGPITKILIADLIDKCETHLIDLGSSLGAIINPYSIDCQVVRTWPNCLRREDLKIIKKHSDKFFKTLNKKIRGIK